MVSEAEPGPARGNWNTAQVYTMAAICLVIGLALGYLFRGSSARPVPSPPATAQTQPAAAPVEGAPQMPSLDQMRHMADKQAEPLLAKLKDEPNNADALKQVAKIYAATHQFKEAAGYFGKALDINPKDVGARTSMASCLYYNGDVDGALAQLQQALKDDPKNADSLFNLGLIRWRGKNDTKGALQAWEQLLKANPKLKSNKKAQVEKLIKEVSRVQAN